MERNYDEVIADMLIELAEIRKRMEKSDKRIELTIRRMVAAESRMEIFDKKLEQSIKDQREQSRTQRKINEQFLTMLSQQGTVLGRIIQKNNLKT